MAQSCFVEEHTGSIDMYQKSVVTFIDILGFRELVSTRPASEVDRAVKLLRRFAGKDRRDPLGVTSISFSDSVVRARPIDQPSAVFFELLDLLHAQGELIGLGVLVRGGIALGDIANEDGRVFGPGFIAAYDLESKSAIYPRIIVAPDLLEQCCALPFKLVNDVEDEYRHIAELLRVGEDGIWHIDYLGAFPEEMDDESLIVPWLKQHKKLIEGLIAAARGNVAGIGMKANWLATYHNNYVSSIDKKWLKIQGAQEKELRVDASKMRTMFSFPTDI